MALPQALVDDLPPYLHGAAKPMRAMTDHHPRPGIDRIVREAPDEFFIKPSAIADELWHLYNQDRSAWSFLTELRPFAERW